MTKKDEAREFWIIKEKELRTGFESFCAFRVRQICPSLEPQIHTIEFSAYQELQEKLRIATEALEVIDKSDSFYSTRQCDVAREALERIK